MSSFEIDVDKVNVNIEKGTAILTGVDLSQIITQVGAEKLLDEMDYLEVTRYVDEQEKDRAEWYS